MAKAKAAKKSSEEPLVVASKVKAYIKKKDMMTSSDALKSISDHVRCLLDHAIDRAKQNKRRTVKPQDL